MIENTLKRNVNLSDYNTYKIGGNADYFIEADSPELLIEALKYSRSKEIPYFILGGGSNILFSDKGFRGIVIRNVCRNYTFDDIYVSAESGILMSELLCAAKNRGLGGIEFVSGIPGTLGGAVAGNAGAYGKSMSQIISEARIINSNLEEITVDCDYFEFAYRFSRLKTNRDVLVSARLKLEKKNQEVIEAEINRIIEDRKDKHPYDMGSCGCFFKNVVTSDSTKISAGKMLDEIGAKNISYGKAIVYEKHANFLLNSGGAKAQDILGLAEILKKKVYDRFNIHLEEEVRIINDTF